MRRKFFFGDFDKENKKYILKSVIFGDTSFLSGIPAFSKKFPEIPE